MLLSSSAASASYAHNNDDEKKNTNNKTHIEAPIHSCPTGNCKIQTQAYVAQPCFKVVGLQLY